MRDNNHVPTDVRKFCEFGGMVCPVSNQLGKRKMKVQGIELDHRGGVWDCVLHISITTASQFTDENHYIAAIGRWWFTAMFRSYMAARRLNRELRAKPGEREAKGWD